MSPKSIAAIIVNYHTASFLPDLIEDILCNSKVKSVFIVDNSGEVRSRDFKQDERIHIIRTVENIGFGGAVNLAAGRADAEYLLLVNPDIRLLPGCIDNLLSAMVKNRAVIAGPRFFWDDERAFKLPPALGASSWLDFALEGSSRNLLEKEHLSFYWQIRHERFWSEDEPFAEPFLSGACLLIDKAWVFSNMGAVFDDRFFLYFEDTDLSARAVFDGLPPICVPDAEAVHYYDQSPNPEEGKGTLMARAHGEFMGKYYPQVEFKFHEARGFQNNLIDLGEVDRSPQFEFECPDTDGRLFFETGVNPVFVPFAQYEIPLTPRMGDGFAGKIAGLMSKKVFPDTLWNRQAKGVYFGRLRHSIKGTLKVWTWKKN